MATHSSIFSWVLPWTEEPGGLQSMGLQKSGMTEVTEHILTWVKKRGFCHEKVQSLARGKDLYVGSNSD